MAKLAAGGGRPRHPQPVLRSLGTRRPQQPLGRQKSSHGLLASAPLGRRVAEAGAVEASGAVQEADQASERRLSHQHASSSAAPDGVRGSERSNGNGSHTLRRRPEDLVLDSGQVSAVDRGTAICPADVFRCAACTEAACQVTTLSHILQVHGSARVPHLPWKDERSLQWAFGACTLAACADPKFWLLPSDRHYGVPIILNACLGDVQGPGGCAQMLWRDEAGGYLREILTARVYDVAVWPSNS